MTTSIQRPAPPRMEDQPGVRFGLASGALVLTMLLAAALPLGIGASAFLALLVTAALSTALPVVWGLGLAVQTWAYFTGFFVNQSGVLTLGARDIRDLLGFVVGTLVLAQVWSPAPALGGTRK